MSDFEKYFNAVCSQMQDAYNEIAATFYTYAGPNVPKELIDQAIFYRLGITDTPPHSNDETVNGILEIPLLWQLQHLQGSKTKPVSRVKEP